MRPRLGVIVNPIAGVGGTVGLKGSDGRAIVALALSRGAVPQAGTRATAALAALATRWPPDRDRPVLLAAPGPMGEESARLAGFEPVVVGSIADASATTAADTRRLAAALMAAGAELLLVAGGDGTARDVCAALPAIAVVVGIPAGVKIHSAVFATSPRAAGELAAVFLTADPGRRRTALGEVLDLDEDAYRRGEVAPRLFGELTVPAEERRLQARKEPSPASEAGAAAALAAEIASSIVPGRRYVLGPGSTVRAVARALGVPKTLVGVDVVEASEPLGAPARLLAGDADGARVLELVAGHDTCLVLTPVGGQGFILGRGNQQLGPGVVRSVLERLGPDGLVVVATPAKLVALRGRPLLVDSGDPDLDAELAGHVRVVTGRGEVTVYPLAAA